MPNYRVPVRIKSNVLFWAAAAVLLLGVLCLVVGSFWYHANGFDACKARGSATWWCLSTSEWQSFRAFCGF